MDDRSNYSKLSRVNSGSNFGKPPTTFSKNLQKMKEDYQAKIAALTLKVEEEKEKQKMRSIQKSLNQTRHFEEYNQSRQERSRSRSHNRQDYDKYVGDL